MGDLNPKPVSLNLIWVRIICASAAAVLISILLSAWLFGKIFNNAFSNGGENDKNEPTLINAEKLKAVVEKIQNRAGSN